MSRDGKVTPVVEATSHTVSVSNVLKQALEWKQWMADDLQLLIDTKHDEGLSDPAIHALVNHHLKTYALLNKVFAMVTGNQDDQLFDLPEVERLQKAIPDLGRMLDENADEKDIEPMLELKLDSLSKELHDDIMTEPKRKDASIISNEQVNQTNEADEGDEPDTSVEETTEVASDVTPVCEADDQSDETAHPEFDENSMKNTGVREDDSKPVSDNTDGQSDEDAPEIVNNQTVDESDKKVLPEEQVSDKTFDDSPIIEVDTPKGSDSQPDDVSTTDLMDKIWDEAFTFEL